jgi:hypothetical protein
MPNYESDGKIEEKEAPSTVLTMRLWSCREECMKSTFMLLHSSLEVGPSPGAMGGDVLLATIKPPYVIHYNPLGRMHKGKGSLEGAQNPKNTLPHAPTVR